MAPHKLIDDAFSENVELAMKIHDAIRDHPSDGPLYFEIAKYVVTLQSKETIRSVQGGEAAQPSAKRRKLENGISSAVDSESLLDHKTKVIFEARDLSFSIPVRKKLHLEMAQAISSTSESLLPVYHVRARSPGSGQLEYTLDIQSLSTKIFSMLFAGELAKPWQTEHALRLPVPEKAQKQYNFVLLPDTGLIIGEGRPATETQLREPLVWAVTEGPQRVTIFSDEKLETAMQAEDGGLIEQTLNKCLRESSARNLIRPDDAEFASSLSEAHRKGEKAYHVKSFRGSKDGYLFFLATGIFFGFKKPLAFFPFEIINSISYTSVLQRTFNLNIAVQLPTQDEIKDHEFSMIDQADFCGIDAYIKRHELQDSSLADSRKAKKLNLNGTKKGGDEGEAEEGEQPGELQKAQQNIEDAEDEEEEDYDPGSEGSSDGSVESSEEESENVNGGGDDVDVVAEELGSEAEEVVPDSGDEDQL